MTTLEKEDQSHRSHLPNSKKQDLSIVMIFSLNTTFRALLEVGEEAIN